jgi:hypothetical protein
MSDPEKRAEFERWREQARGFLSARQKAGVRSSRRRKLPPRRRRLRRRKEPAKPVAENANAEASKPESDEAPAPEPPKPGIYVEEDDVVRFRRLPEKGEKYRVLLEPGPMQVAGIRAELASGDKASRGLPNGGQRGGLKLAFSIRPEKGKEKPVSVYRAEATAKEPRYANGAEIIGVQSGWKFSEEQMQANAASVWMFDPPVKLAEGDRLVVTFEGDSVVPVRLGVSPFSALDPLAVVDTAFRKALGKDANDVLADRYLWSTAWDATAFSEAKRLQREILECREGRSWTMITQAVAEPMTMRVLPRGNWQDEKGEVVFPNVPHFLPQPENPKGSDSRGLTSQTGFAPGKPTHRPGDDESALEAILRQCNQRPGGRSRGTRRVAESS